MGCTNYDNHVNYTTAGFIICCKCKFGSQCNDYVVCELLHDKVESVHFQLCYWCTKGLETQRLIGSAVAGFNLARTITKASATGLDAGQDYYKKGICSPGSLVNNPVR